MRQGASRPGSLAESLAALGAAGLRRQRRSVTRPEPATARVVVDGREAVDFCSNDYLGLAGHPGVAAAFAAAAQRDGAGARASHLVGGHQPEHEALERELAAFTGRERALVFSTGYMANLGAVTALVGRGGLVLEDRLNHASLIDAGLLSGARFARYAHADADALGRALARHRQRPALVVTDGVFSMDGDVAPLPALAAACRAAGAWLVVDDAHGLGVLGEGGRGSLALHRLGSADVPVLVGTFGKAFGGFGAFVAGDEEIVETLIQRARSYIYTTALPSAVAAAARAALAASVAEPWRRERVLALTARFRGRALAAGLPLADSPTPIQPVLLGSPGAATGASERLLARGYFVAAIRPPTVPAGTSRLRVTLSAAHGDEDVDGLVDALAAACAESEG